MSAPKWTAGRELDALVAENVMGLKVERDVWDTRSQNELTPYYDLGIRDADGQVTRSVPNYSRNIAAAWLVVDKLKVEWIVTMEIDEYATRVGLGKNYASAPVELHWSADTTSLAICGVALAARGAA